MVLLLLRDRSTLSILPLWNWRNKLRSCQLSNRSASTKPESYTARLQLRGHDSTHDTKDLEVARSVWKVLPTPDVDVCNYCNTLGLLIETWVRAQFTGTKNLLIETGTFYRFTGIFAKPEAFASKSPDATWLLRELDGHFLCRTASPAEGLCEGPANKACRQRGRAVEA